MATDMTLTLWPRAHRFGIECFGHDNIYWAQSLGASYDCTMPCPGAPDQMCGGPGALSISDLTGSYAIPKPDPVPTAAEDARQFLGCFKQDRAPNHRLPVNLGGSSSNSPSQCQARARLAGYSVFAVRGFECLVGELHPFEPAH